MSMTEQEKAFLATSDEYKTEVFTIVQALKTLQESDRIGGLSISTSEDHKEFMEDVRLVLKTLNKFDGLGEYDEDEIDDDKVEPEKVYKMPSCKNEMERLDEIETFMSNTSEALLHLTKQIADIKFKTMLNSKAIIKLIEEKE